MSIFFPVHSHKDYTQQVYYSKTDCKQEQETRIVMAVAIFEHVIVQDRKYRGTSGEERIQEADNFARVLLIKVDNVGVKSYHVGENRTQTWNESHRHNTNKITEPRCEKTDLRSFRPSLTQTRLYNHRRWLEAWNSGFRKKRNRTIYVAKTKALITAQFVLAYSKSRFLITRLIYTKQRLKQFWNHWGRSDQCLRCALEKLSTVYQAR